MKKFILIIITILLSFIITSNSSATPVLISPSTPTVQYLSTLKPSFQWSQDAGSDGYNLCVSSSADFAGTSTVTVTGTSYTPDSNYSQGRYFWRVRSYVGSSYSAWSSTGEFVLDTSSPVFSEQSISVPSFNPLSGTPINYSKFTYKLNEVSTITLNVSGPLPSASTVRNISDEVIFRADFNNDDLTPWQISYPYPDAPDGDTWAIISDDTGTPPKKHKVLSVIKADSISASNTEGMILIGDVNWSDYAVEVDAKSVNGDITGIIFKMANTDFIELITCYEFILKYDSGEIELGKRIDSDYTTISKSSMLLSKNKWYKLKVEVAGSSIRCYVDSSIPALYITDTSIPAGRVGLIALTSGVSISTASVFDNFCVYKLGNTWNGKKDDGNLVSEGSYTYKVSARDLAGNTTETFAIIQVDISSPSAITDLSASLSGVGSGEVRLNWTVPYDAFGVTGYIIKYTTFSINDTNWNSSIISTFTQSWTPVGTGSTESQVVSGLLNATTYYFAIKCFDGVQNISLVSNSPAMLTNAPPIVNVVKPDGSTGNIGSITDSNKTTLYCVNWEFSDPNPGDSQTFEIWLSSGNDEGGNPLFTVFVSSGIPNGTTFYWLDTLRFEDLNYSLKVLATDSHGTTSDSSPFSNVSPEFGIRNYDFAPEVTITYPNGGENLYGAVTFYWDISDKNTWEIPYITYDLWVSTIGLIDASISNLSMSWQLAATKISGTSYQFGTGNYPNSNCWAIRILANGVTSYWRDVSFAGGKFAYDISNSTFEVNNINRPPNQFSLLSPAKASIVSSLRPTFSWASTTDPDINDYIKYYKLWYSTTSNFSVKTEVKNITTNSWTATSDFQNEMRYYWKVRAYDKFLTYRESTETDWYFDTNRQVISSDDGKLSIQITGTLPTSDTYVFISSNIISNSSALISAAQKINENAFARSISDVVYEVKLIQNNTVLDPSVLVNATISLECPYSVDSNGYLNYLDFPASYLKIVKLNETENKWVLAGQNQTVTVNTQTRKATVSVSVNSLSTFGLIAYDAPTSILFDVSNFPNPFNPNNNEKTTISFGLTKDSKVTINVFNLVGDLVWEKTITNPSYDSTGMTKYREDWDGKNGDGMLVATGMYICRVTAEPKDGSASVVLLRKIGVKNK